jgi:hypothetical protein
MRAALAGAALLLAALPASAETVGGCDTAALQGPALTECLTSADQQASASLKATLEAALDSIRTRSGVFDSQRARWRNSLAESQEMWLRWRNAECQNVAPYEGQAASSNVMKNRVAAFEAKLACTIRTSEARREDLAARYPAR